MTALEADKALSVCRWPSLPGPSSGEARPGQASAPLYCQGQLQSAHVAQNRSAQGHSVDSGVSEKKHTGGVKGPSRTRRLPSAPAAIYSARTTLLSPNGENWIKGIAAWKLNVTIKMQIVTGYTISCCRRRRYANRVFFCSKLYLWL